jgi:hypothetical protein
VETRTLGRSQQLLVLRVVQDQLVDIVVQHLDAGKRMLPPGRVRLLGRQDQMHRRDVWVVWRAARRAARLGLIH